MKKACTAAPRIRWCAQETSEAAFRMGKVAERSNDDNAVVAFGLCFPPTSTLELDAISVDVSQAKQAASVFQ